MVNNNILKIREEIINKRREVEKEVANLIKNTKFYEKYEYSLMEWYYNYDEEFLVISGGYGIGKSKTIKQILNSKGIPFKIINKRIEYEKDMLEFLDGLESGGIVVFDDSFVSKRVEQMLFSLVNKNVRPIFIVNDVKELDNIKKVLGRIKKVYLNMSTSDLEHIKEGLSEKYNVTYDDYVILNLRDLVNVTTYELVKEINPYKPKLTIEEILEEIDNIYDRKSMLKAIVEKIYEKRIITDEEVLVDIAVKVLSYEKSTAKKYLRQILKEIW